MKNSIVIGSAVIGVALIALSAINSGAINLKDEHIVTTTQGAVKLGNIYQEKRLLSIKMTDSDGNVITSIQNINPDSYIDEIKKNVDAEVKAYNSSVSKEKKLTRDDAAVVGNAVLNIESSMEYHAEYIPLYTLVLDTEDVNVSKGTTIYGFMTSSVAKFLEKQQVNYSAASYIK